MKMVIWNIKQKKDEINSLYESKEFLLEDWLEQYGTPELRQKVLESI